MPLWAHDYVFWCGDFNYRINKPRDEVIDLVQRQEWALLLEDDQLTVFIFSIFIIFIIFIFLLFLR